jgi:hypothetical protein
MLKCNFAEARSVCVTARSTRHTERAYYFPLRNTALRRQIFAVFFILVFCGTLPAEMPSELRLGRAGHAFDHLGDIGVQADAAAASGATIIYSGGLGEAGYHGLPPQGEFAVLRKNVGEYSRRAKNHGIELNIGYLCATSIIKLDTFDKNWTDEFRAQFKTRPAEWRQQDRQGKPLASWYGGDYQPACMSNPDWRAYEHAMVRFQLETGNDGVFFDNPTVHPRGCYCPHCMRAFLKYFVDQAPKALNIELSADLEQNRELADENKEMFLRFRSTIARDFLADMRAYARTINPRALITCNNSLNSPTVFYSQCRTYGYNIDEMSKAEDFVVVEDQNTQPRAEANGQVFEYGPTYKQLHAISHGKPIVAVTIANGDYHTPPNLMRLAMAEAAANNASYLSWPTWPEDQRKRMIAEVRPQAEFLRRNEELLNDSPFRADVALYLPFQRWVNTDQCAASALAATLTKENIQYRVVSEDNLDSFAKQKPRPVLLVESRSIFKLREQPTMATIDKQEPGVVAADQPDWLQQLRKKVVKPSVTAKDAPNVRAVVHDQAGRTIVHLYNLNIQRLSSFEDKVKPATDIGLEVTTPSFVRSVSMRSGDESETSGPLKFQALGAGSGSLVQISIPRLDISAIIVIEP